MKSWIFWLASTFTFWFTNAAPEPEHPNVPEQARAQPWKDWERGLNVEQERLKETRETPSGANSGHGTVAIEPRDDVDLSAPKDIPKM